MLFLVIDVLLYCNIYFCVLTNSAGNQTFQQIRFMHLPKFKGLQQNGGLMKNKYLICFLLFLCLILTACSKNITNTGNPASDDTTTSTSADYPQYESAKELVEASDLVFSGTVTEIKYEMLDVRTESEKDSSTGLTDSSENLPYTIYVIKIETLYKGSSDSDKISIKVLGDANNDESFVSDGSPSLTVGNRYLFTTVTFANSYPSLLNLSQSTYQLDVSSENTITGSESATVPENSDTTNPITISQILALFQ